VAKGKTGTRRKRARRPSRDDHTTKSGRSTTGTIRADQDERDIAGRDGAADRDAGRPSGATRTARRELSTPRTGDAADDGNSRSRAAAAEPDSGAETETALESDMREGDNPRAASAESGTRRRQPPTE